MSTKIQFSHLHSHSTYSLGDATTLIPDLVKRVKDLGMSSVALTDHGTMAGVVEFMKECKKQEIKPIIGMEAYIALKSAKDPLSFTNPTGHIILLARNTEGYRNLCALLQEATQPENFSYTPRIDFELLSKYSKGLIGLTACVGGLPQKCLLGWSYYDRETKSRLKQPPLLDQLCPIVDKLSSIFEKDHFYLEVMNHKLPPALEAKLSGKAREDYEWMRAAQTTVAKDFLALSKKTNIPVVMTNDFHYLSNEMMDTRQAILAIDGRGHLDTIFDEKMADPKLLEEHANQKHGLQEITGQLYVKSPEEMMEAGHYSQYPELINNTQVIADMCEKIDLSPKKDEKGRTIWNLPVIDTGKLSMIETLTNLANKGFDERYPGLPDDSEEVKAKPWKSLSYKKKAQERLVYELSVMENLGLESYHIMVADMVEYAKSKGIRVGPGRGSGAGSIVVYCLGITDLDPIRHSLLFERYLNPERASAADLDVDFDPKRVNEVFDYVVGKYGRENVARISSYGSLHAKGSIRRLARAMCLSQDWVDDLSEQLPEDQGEFRTKLSEVVGDTNSMTAATFKKFVAQGGDTAKHFLNLAVKLDDVKISRGQHAAGIVVSGTPLKDIVPLVFHDREDTNSIATEIPFEFLEEMGLLKQDLLVVDGLTIIDQASKFIEERHGIAKFELPKELDETYDDPLAIDIFSKGDLAGIWQMSSHGMRELCVSLQPKDLEEIAAICALYRPGPLDFIDNETGFNMVETYIRRKRGLLPVSYDHESLKSVLGTTYGVIVFQEQIMEIARVLCGWTYAQADYLRKAVGKKLPEEIEKQKLKFIPAAIAHSKIDEYLANRIWGQIETFGRYGFNKSHSAAYGKLSYQMAWIKGRYPVEFLAAAISSASDKNDKAKRTGLLHDFVDECLRKSIKVLTPDITRSKAITIPENKNTIRLGFNSIRGVATAAEKLEQAGVTSGIDLAEAIRKVYATGVNKTAVKGLVNAGAFDEFGERAHLMACAEHMAELRLKKSKKKIEEFFGLTLDKLPSNVPPATPQQNEDGIRECLSLVTSLVPKPDPKHIIIDIGNKVEPLLSITDIEKGKTYLKLLVNDGFVEAYVDVGAYKYPDLIKFLVKNNFKIIGIV